jgi:SAM-dependent methyltransferase
MYLTPRPEPHEFDDFYPTDYLAYQGSIKDEKHLLRRMDRQRSVSKLARQVFRHTRKPGKILDIGCATGAFLNEMKNAGWVCTGIEPSHYAATFAKDHYDLDVREGFLQDQLFPEESFDVITLWDVLEHVPDPITTLHQVSRLVKPGGLVVIRIPNPDSFDRRIFGKYWAGWDIPRHFFGFPASTFINLVQSAGLCLVDSKCHTAGFGAFAISLDFWLTGIQVKTQTRVFIGRIASSLPTRALLFPFYAFANQLNRGSFITFFSKKPPE